MQKKSAALLLLIAFVLSACGFKLRGALELPAAFSDVYLSVKSSTVLVDDLRTILKTSGVSVIEDATVANAVITINKESTEQRVLSVDENGRAREYEIKYSVVFSVSNVVNDSTNKVKIDQKTLELVRDYFYDSNAVLGKSREKNRLIRDMQRDASRLIMLQIQAAYRQPGAGEK